MCASRLLPSVGCAAESCDPCVLAHAAPTCAGGECAIAACELGYGDCNGSATDGCETDLRSDPAHCGGCGQTCSFPRAGGACVAGRCEPAAGEDGWAECDGDPGTVCETHLADDPAHCGACRAACVLPFASQTLCTEGQCRATQCVPGRADCSALLADGCETDILRNDAHCGGCGIACAKEQVCAAGQCRPRCHAIRALHPLARMKVQPTGFGVGSGDFTLEVWVAVREPTGSPACGMNESYPVNAVRLMLESSFVSCFVINPKGAGAGSGSAVLTGPGLEVGRWYHVACVRKNSTLTLCIDGKPVSSSPVALDLVELSPFQIGLPEWASTAGKKEPGTSSFGPLRFSKTARYVGPFTPSADWPIDADTVAQFLTELPYTPGTTNPLVDEAGGDNLVTDYGGFAPDLADVPCGG